MANSISAKNRNAKPLFNVYKESEKGELVSDKYGFMPSSVWNVKKTKQLVEYVSDTFATGSYTKGQKKKKGQQKLSLLPPDIAMRVIKFYTLPGDNVYDPFSNRGVGSMIAYLAGRNGYCTEIVPTYVEDMISRFARAKEDVGSDNILEVRLADARHSPYEDEKFDLVYTSPPFPLEIEKYESVDGQLTDISDYKEFMAEMFECIKEAYRVTKYGGFTVWQVNDARRNGKFYDIHGDFCKLLRKAGFKQHDIIINQLNSASMTGIGTIEKAGSKIMPKCHEYLLVFKKPYKEGKYKGKHRFEKMAMEKKEREGDE